VGRLVLFEVNKDLGSIYYHSQGLKPDTLFSYNRIGRLYGAVSKEVISRTNFAFLTMAF